MQKGQGVIFILVGVLVVVLIASGVFYLDRTTLRQNPSGQATPNPSPTSQSTSTPSTTTSDETANWKTYTNNKYNYSFQYSDNFEVRSGGYGQLPITEESQILVVSFGIKMTNSGRLSVRVINELCQGEPNSKSISIKSGLKSFADKIWQLNNDNNQLKETTLDGQKAYQFFTNDSWSDDCGGMSLNQKNQALITEKGGLIYVILFPTDDKTYLQILSTFRFD